MLKPLFGTRIAALVLAQALFLQACGRKATAQDCEVIVERIAELELARLAPGRDTSAEVTQTKKALRGKALEKCVGHRIREGALECVRAATSAEEIIDDCFD